MPVVSCCITPTVKFYPLVGRCAVCVAAILCMLLSERSAGEVWNVSTPAELHFACEQTRPGDEIVIAPGTYQLTGTLTVHTSNLIIRGATGNRDDVVILGSGMNSADGARTAIEIYTFYVTIKDLTVSECYWHGIHFQNNANLARVSNVCTLNIGEHHMKGVRYTSSGVLEHCLFLQTKVRENDGVARPDNYLGGPDFLGARSWVIRDNMAMNINAAQPGLGDPGIFLWQEIIDCVTERNVIINCNKGIGYGNPSAGTLYHAEGGIIRSNFIVRGNDIGLELCYTKNVKVYNNTIYSENDNYFRSLHILDNTTIPTVNLDLRYNIIRGRILDNTRAGGWTSTGDIVGSTATPDWFVDPLNGDLHLTALATPAIDAAAPLIEVQQDADGDPRPTAAQSDVGADEYAPYAAGDSDFDGDVDLADAASLIGQMTGPVVPKVYHEYGGNVVMEAEHYSQKTDGSGSAEGSAWLFMTGYASRGDGLMRANPDAGVSVDAPYIESDAPHMSYSVEFSTAGTYYLWLRATAVSDASSDFHYGLDGVAVSSNQANSATAPDASFFVWQSLRDDGGRPTIVVPSPGPHTVDLWMREDGPFVDQLLLTTDASYTPVDPLETPQHAVAGGDLDGDGDVDLRDAALLAGNFSGSP